MMIVRLQAVMPLAATLVAWKVDASWILMILTFALAVPRLCIFITCMMEFSARLVMRTRADACVSVCVRALCLQARTKARPAVGASLKAHALPTAAACPKARECALPRPLVRWCARVLP